MRDAWARLGFTLSAVIAFGCGGQSTSGGPSGPVAQNDFPSALAHAICANIGPCCRQEKQPFTEANCETVLRQIYSSELSIKDGFDPDTAGQCVDELGGYIGQCNFGSSTVSPSCQKVTSRSMDVHGKEGDPCSGSCTTNGTSTSCSSSISSGSVSPDGGVETPSTSATCYSTDGLYCDFSTGRCAKPAPIGSSCGSTEGCLDSFCFFDPSTLSSGSVCTAKRREGETCRYEEECEAGLACAGSSFGTSDGVCTKPKPVGAACESGSECASDSCRNGKCDVSALLRLACAP